LIQLQVLVLPRVCDPTKLVLPSLNELTIQPCFSIVKWDRGQLPRLQRLHLCLSLWDPVPGPDTWTVISSITLHVNYEAAWCPGERLFAAASRSPHRPAFHFKLSDHPEVATALRTAARHKLNVASIAPLYSSSWDESIFEGVLHLLQRIGSPLIELELPKAGNESLALLVPVASQQARVVAKRLTVLPSQRCWRWESCTLPERGC
jgi:hypothetical protein